MNMNKVFASIHSAGVIFVIIGVTITAILFSIQESLGWISFIITGWMAYFFRDPIRTVPEDKNLIVSPADGTVCSILKNVALPKEVSSSESENFEEKNSEKDSEIQEDLEEGEYTKISIFLNVFDVHVNRMPYEGKIKKHQYVHGKFFNASLDKASIHNERNLYLVETEDNWQYCVVQIAGLVAKRILFNTKIDDVVSKGQRYGIIRFGSRVDLYLPSHINLNIYVGQKTIGGETIIANLDYNSSLNKHTKEI